jgi:hypothetical protein
MEAGLRARLEALPPGRSRRNLPRKQRQDEDGERLKGLQHGRILGRGTDSLAAPKRPRQATLCRSYSGPWRRGGLDRRLDVTSSGPATLVHPLAKHHLARPELAR